MNNENENTPSNGDKPPSTPPPAPENGPYEAPSTMAQPTPGIGGQLPPPSGNIPPGYVPSSDDKTMAMLCHLLLLLTGFGGIIIWAIKKDESPFVDFHGKDCLNGFITSIIAMVVATIIATVTCGIGSVLYLYFVVPMIFHIIGAVKAYNGEYYRVPVNIPFIK